MPEPTGWLPGRYGEDIADVYDEWSAELQDTSLAVDFLVYLMAELAGIKLRDRRFDWSGATFGASSFKHVSVYEKVS